VVASPNMSHNYHFLPWHQEYKVYDSEGLLYIPLGGATCVDSAYYRFDENGIELVVDEFVLDSVLLDTRAKQIITASYDYQSTNTIITVVNYVSMDIASFEITADEIEEKVKGGLTLSQLDASYLLVSLIALGALYTINQRRSKMVK
jgi:hypothetical protein